MSNLRFSDNDLDAMANHPNARAMRIGRTEPYHLAYVRAHRGNDIINPRLPGQRPVATRQEETSEN